ncbi:tRNA (adenosine(37)-N6)-threonylcarbamoyltransferase complex dimerization subunit type 1 TsaB [Paenibacillus cisolokensis]|uniref:tRNA (adenosine(37)-N6)-threonylcarbamoyltransferase complex dimerization subunit type 1 TsaB n=1 Tax=Paenibacillus cisolokensis TaxID=1658519 RepID=UPI003D2A7207
MNDKERKREKMDNPVVLALDTSTASLAAAVVRGTEVLGEIGSVAERNHSVLVVPKLQELLRSCGLTGRQVDGIAAGRGPGSYTGMRIGVTVAKTLAWAWGKPLVGVSSLEGLAYGAFHRGMEQQAGTADRAGAAAADAGADDGTTWIVPIMDARRGQVYTGAFAAGDSGAKWERLADDGIRMMDRWMSELLQRLEAERHRRVRNLWIAGDLTQHEAAAGRLGEDVAAAFGDDAPQVRLLTYYMEGRWIGRLGGYRLAAGESDDVHALVPNYTQLAEAEAKLLAREEANR